MVSAAAGLRGHRRSNFRRESTIVRSSTLPFRLPLSRYVQLRVDYTADSQGETALDFIQPDYGAPAAGLGILAQITPTQAQLGVASIYVYALLPAFTSLTEGFNRIDVTVPSSRTTLLWLAVDGLPWTRFETPPDFDQPDTEWLDGLSLDGRE